MPLISSIRRTKDPPKMEVMQKDAKTQVKVRFEYTNESKLLRPYLDLSSDSNVVVLEEPPCTKRVFYSSCEKVELRSFQIEKPWSYFLISFKTSLWIHQAGIFFSRSRLKSDRDPRLLLSPFPNNTYSPTRSTGLNFTGVCLGRVTLFGSNPINRAFQAYDLYWSTPFNAEMSLTGGGDRRNQTILKRMCKKGASLRKSKANPDIQRAVLWVLGLERRKERLECRSSR